MELSLVPVINPVSAIVMAVVVDVKDIPSVIGPGGVLLTPRQKRIKRTLESGFRKPNSNAGTEVEDDELLDLMIQKGASDCFSCGKTINEHFQDFKK